MRQKTRTSELEARTGENFFGRAWWGSTGDAGRLRWAKPIPAGRGGNQRPFLRHGTFLVAVIALDFAIVATRARVRSSRRCDDRGTLDDYGMCRRLQRRRGNALSICGRNGRHRNVVVVALLVVCIFRFVARWACALRSCRNDAKCA
jgi:hypothetical protein